MNNLCKVAVVGRPNVGKSTLFNRFLGKKHALVDDTPGVTRDRREGKGKLFDLFFTVVDTAGLETIESTNLQKVMEIQTNRAIDEADVILFMIDGREGITPIDHAIAERLRPIEKPVIFLVNKIDGRKDETAVAEAFKLGLKSAPISFSAEHGWGLDLLYEQLMPIIDSFNKDTFEETTANTDTPIQLSIMGQPNAGKSTLINKLLNDERLITGPEAGMTRDSISVDWMFNNHPIKLVDTAGIRKAQKVHEKLEKLSVRDARRAVEFSHVVILLIDAQYPLEKQDMKLAKYVVQEGRGLIVALNKWDAVKSPDKIFEDVKYRLENHFSPMKDVPILPVSALKGTNLTKMLQKSLDVYDRWNLSFTTSQLNKWVQYAVSRNQPPLSSSGRRIKIKYATQVRRRPPALALYCNLPKEMPKSYIRYLQNSLRESFDTQGVPIRLYFRGGENPYVKKG